MTAADWESAAVDEMVDKSDTLWVLEKGFQMVDNLDVTKGLLMVDE